MIDDAFNSSPKDIKKTKFFSVLLSDVVGDGAAGLDNLSSADLVCASDKKSDVDWPDKRSDLEYLRNFVGEIEKRRMYALMCLNPVKIGALGGAKLANLIRSLSDLSDRLNKGIRALERANVPGSKYKELTDDDKRAIEQLIGSK